MKENKFNQSLFKSHVNDSELTILVDSVRSITSSLDLGEVLKKIIRNTLKVIPPTAAGYLLLYDNDSERRLLENPAGLSFAVY